MMIAVLAGVVALVLFSLIWRGSSGQQQSVQLATRGAGAVLCGALLIGGLFIVTDPGENLVIVEAAMEGTVGSERQVSGVVENRTDREMSPVRLEVDFIDRDSRIIGGTLVETDQIDAGGVWEFMLPIPSDSVVGFRGRVGSPDNVRPAWLGGGCGSAVCAE